MNDKTDTPDLSLPIDPRLLTEQGVIDLLIAGGWTPPPPQQFIVTRLADRAGSGNTPMSAPTSQNYPAAIADHRWLPIADAPRDGTPVLVFDALEETQTTAYWQPHENSGMWFLCSSDQFGEPMPCDPTHYKPLGPDPEHGP